MSENKRSLMEAVESKGAGIVIPMLNPKDLQVKISAVVPPAYADALECNKRWSERFKKQCAEVVDQHKDVLDFEDKDRIEGNKPVVAEKPVRVEDQKITESLKDGNCLNEALYGMNQIEQFVKMADAIGLKTMGDFKDFMDREGQGKDVLTALYDYLHNEIGDLDFHAKDESLKEDYQDVDSMSREELMDEIDGIYEWALKGKHIDITSIIEDPEVFPNDKDDEEGYFKGVPTDKLRGILKILRKMKDGGSLTKDDEKVFLSKNGSMNESLDFTDEAEIRKQLDKYSGQYLTITFKGSGDWKHISDLLDDAINSDEEEDEESALDELESSYRKEYDLLKSLEVEEISDIADYTSYVVVTIKVDKDNLIHNFSDNYSDLINMPSIDKDTIKILELDKPTVQSINTSSRTRDEMVDFIDDYIGDTSDDEYEKFKDEIALNFGLVWDNLKEDPEEWVYPSFTDNGLRIIIDKIIKKAKPVTESYNRFKGPDYKKYKSLKEGYLDNIKNPDYWQHQVDYQLEKFGRVGGGLIQDLDENGFYLNADNKVTKKIQEDIVKNSKGKWVNKGEEGTHGEFNTKKEADA